VHLLNSIKQTPFFGNMLTLKTKHVEKRRLKEEKNEQGDTVICSSAKTKAEVLCDFFSSVFCNKADNDFEPLKERLCSYESTLILISEDDTQTSKQIIC